MGSMNAKPIDHPDLLAQMDALYNFVRTLSTDSIDQIETGISDLKALDYSIKTKAEFNGKIDSGHGPGRLLIFSESYIGEEICARCFIKIIHDDPDQWTGYAHNTSYDLTIYNETTHNTLFPGNPRGDEEVIDLIGTGVYQETEFTKFQLDQITGLATPIISPENTSEHPFDSFNHSYAKDLDVSNIKRRIDFKGHLWSKHKANSTHKAVYILSLDINCDWHCYDVVSYPGTAIEKQIEVTYGAGAEILLEQYRHVIKMYNFLSRYSWEEIEDIVSRLKARLEKN